MRYTLVTHVTLLSNRINRRVTASLFLRGNTRDDGRYLLAKLLERLGYWSDALNLKPTYVNHHLNRDKL